MTEGPRRHHYAFAHQELRGAALSFGTDLVDAGRDATLTLPAVWDRLGASLAEHERLDSDGLASTYHEIGRHRVLLVRLPAARHPTEAHFVAIAVPAQGDAVVRYLTLEHAVSPIDGSTYTVLGEWTDQGHLNCGEGPPVDPDAFLAAVEQRLA